jgi:hypothetical protein
MKNIISSYVTAMDELNLLVSASYHTADHAAQVADDLLSGLIHAYTRTKCIRYAWHKPACQSG